MAGHPCRQLGSASGSIRWAKELRKVWLFRSLWRQVDVARSPEWCHGMIPGLVFIKIQGFLQVENLVRRFFCQSRFRIDVISPLSRLLSILLPEGERVSSVASLSAVSLPAIPEWLGIQ